MNIKIIVILLLPILVFEQCISSNEPTEKFVQAPTCNCDSLKTVQHILDSNYLKIIPFDTSTFPPEGLYGLSAADNRFLWYRDIESPDSTKFTRYWNDYVPFNYHANPLDFIIYFQNKQAIELAFQLGPTGILWGYHIFVIKKIDCCYLITRSYFPHARFTYKAYSILDNDQLANLYNVLDPIPKFNINAARSNGYRGYFMDNRNKTKFYLNFEASSDTSSSTLGNEIVDFFDFLDKNIKWTVTYN